MDDNNAPNSQRIVAMFEEGKRFTEEVLQENERLRLVIAGLKNEVRDLGNRYVRVDIPRLKERVQLLEEENRTLRRELEDVKAQYDTVEKENWDFSERYLHVERQNNSLLNLYVAAQRLHSTLELCEALQIVKEIVINMVGSERFEICLADQSRNRLVPIAAEGSTSLDTREIDETVATVLEAGALPATRKEGGAGPIACIPMRLSGRPIGVITIHELLPHKPALEPLDFELFDLLGEHAAAAICSSHVFSSSDPQEDDSTWSHFIDEVAERTKAEPVS